MPKATLRQGMGAAILCKCGCGAGLTEYDDRGRLREFVNGHYIKWLARQLAKAGGDLREGR